jgi:alpha-methylacyl-CoA racemase
MGPLHGLKVLEFEGIGPGPLAGMILADMGAQVTVIRRPGGSELKKQLGGAGDTDILNRGKQQVAIDLKKPEGIALALRLVEQVDALIEGNRPGVMERLGLGPDVCLEKNPRLVYGRMTGWGQSGPLAQAAGHDLNYIALSGLLATGRPGDVPPRVPPTLAGDAIGALGLAFGIVAAAFETKTSGQGQVVDAAITDLVAVLGSIAHWIGAAGQLGGAQPSVFYDSPHYDLYQCSDGKWITLGALEPQFFALLIAKLELTDVPKNAQHDVAAWPKLKARLTTLFKSQPQAHWCALLEGSDACFAPVLSPAEAARHPHNVARRTYSSATALQANPAPRFSRSVPSLADAKLKPGEIPALLAALGLTREQLATLRAAGVLG